MSDRLASGTLDRVAAGVSVPRYDRKRGARIVHLGVGAFHKAHQAVYTDAAIERSGGDWMITGVSLRAPDAAERLNPQDGLYTLLKQEPAGATARIVGSIGGVLVAPADPAAVLERLAAPETAIVSLTVTEKGYGIDPATGGLDRTDAAIAADLASPRAPRSAVGFIVEGIRLRRERGLPPFTVLSCDNLPRNGATLRRLAVAFAGMRDAGLAAYIADVVPFPSTMVDRITPASTGRTLADARHLTGLDDLAAIETEPFSQWIIEDGFAGDRPDWEAGGALFVGDVAPYETMKLRMLNGAHSLIAYAGFMAGHAHVRDAMADAALARIAARHMHEAAKTLEPVPGVDLAAYAQALLARFANPAIAHRTYQIAMDGTQKLPQRLLDPAVLASRARLPLDTYAFAVAAWMCYCLGIDEAGTSYDLRDPRQAEIAARLAGEVDGTMDTEAVVASLLALPGLFPAELVASVEFHVDVHARLDAMRAHGMRYAIRDEAERAGQAGW